MFQLNNYFTPQSQRTTQDTILVKPSITYMNQVKVLQNPQKQNINKLPELPYKEGKAFKQQIINWLRIQTKEKLSEAFSFTSQLRVSKILQLYEESRSSTQDIMWFEKSSEHQLTPSLLTKHSEKIIKQTDIKGSQSIVERQRSYKLQKKFLTYVRVCDIKSLYDTLCLAREAVNDFEKFRSQLDDLTNCKIFEQIPTIERSTDSHDIFVSANPGWFRSPYTICHLILSEFEQAIITRFLEHSQDIKLTEDYQIRDLVSIKAMWLHNLSEKQSIMFQKSIDEYESIVEQNKDFFNMPYQQKRHEIRFDQSADSTNSAINLDELHYEQITDQLLMKVVYRHMRINYQTLNFAEIAKSISLKQPEELFNNLLFSNLNDFFSHEYFIKKILFSAINEEYRQHCAAELTLPLIEVNKKKNKNKKKKKSPAELQTEQQDEYDQLKIISSRDFYFASFIQNKVTEQDQELCELSRDFVNKNLEQVISGLADPLDKKVEVIDLDTNKTEQLNQKSDKKKPMDKSKIERQKTNNLIPLKEILIQTENICVTLQSTQLKQGILSPTSNQSVKQLVSQQNQDKTDNKEYTTSVSNSDEEVSKINKSQKLSHYDDDDGFQEVEAKHHYKVFQRKFTQTKSSKKIRINNDKKAEVVEKKHQKTKPVIFKEPAKVQRLAPTIVNSAQNDNIDNKLNEELVQAQQSNQEAIKQEPQLVPQAQKQSSQDNLKISTKQLNSESFNNKLTNDLEGFHDSIFRQNQMYVSARRYVIRIVRDIIQHKFNADIKLFGSCATGLELMESDIDLAIIGCEMLSRVQQIQLFHELEEELKTLPCIVLIKPILTASVPLMKLEIDSSISFGYNSVKLMDGEKNKIIQVDLTFETLDPSCHQGHQSTDQINQWCKQFNGFNLISLLLKYIIKKSNLNDSYSGGISSYCLTVMISAVFLENRPLQPGEILQTILEKFGNNFDPDTEGVDINNQGFFQFESCPINPPLTVYSPITNTIISFGATKISKIIDEFRRIKHWIDSAEAKFVQNQFHGNILELYFKN